MRKFQYTFETLKQSFISVFSICMTVPLMFDMSCELIEFKITLNQ